MPEETARISLTVNGEPVTLDVLVRRHLVDFLRLDLELTGSHLGCEHGVCGACTVLLDGMPTRSCVLPVRAVSDADIETIEGLSEDNSHPLQVAWIEAQVPQCGYCQSGMIMAAEGLLRSNPNPSDADIAEAMTNLCRCGTYQRIRRAIHTAADTREMKPRG